MQQLFFHSGHRLSTALKLGISPGLDYLDDIATQLAPKNFSFVCHFDRTSCDFYWPDCRPFARYQHSNINTNKKQVL